MICATCGHKLRWCEEHRHWLDNTTAEEYQTSTSDPHGFQAHCGMSNEEDGHRPQLLPASATPIMIEAWLAP